MARQGDFSSAALNTALRYLRARPDAAIWRQFWTRILLVGGMLSLVAGVLFFIAWNWNGLSHFSKFALLQSAVALSLGAALYKGLDSLTGTLGLLTGGLLIGPLFAVYGQTYQSGAEVWELFRAWGIFFLPLALAGRRAALFLPLWLIGNIWSALYLDFGAALERESFFPLLTFQCGQVLCLVLWEAAFTWKGATQPWLAARWLPRLAALFIVGCMTLISLVFLIFGGSDVPSDFIRAQTLLHTLALIAGWFWYRKKTHDLFMLTCILGSPYLLLLGIMTRRFISSFDSIGNIWVLLFGVPLFSGLIIIGLTTVLVRVLRRCQQQMTLEHAAREMTEQTSALSGKIEAFPAPGLSVSAAARWKALRDTMRNLGHWPEALPCPPPAAQQDKTMPWFLLLIQGVSGWVAAWCFSCFAGVFLMIWLEGVSEASMQSQLFLIGVTCLLAARAISSERDTPFFTQFSFAIALSGATILSLDFAWAASSFSNTAAGLAAAAGMAVSFALFRHPVFRTLTAFAFFLCLAGSMENTLYGDFFFRNRLDDLEQMPLDTFYILAHGVSWCAAVCFLVMGVLWETRWNASRRLSPLAAPALYAVGALLPCLLLLCDFSGRHLFFHIGYAAKILGVCAGAGLFCLAFQLASRLKVRTVAPILCAAALSIPAGWFLPGLSLALLYFALAREVGSRGIFALTACFLLVNLGDYYYSLALPFPDKSLLLATCGLVLLFLGVLLTRKPPAALLLTETAHA
jgi:uncharacterized membrane protein